MSIGRIYLSTDSGAPVLTGQQATLKELLKKVLVGSAGIAYGTKPPLGWSLEYETTDKAVFKGEVGSSGMLLRVDDSGSGASSYREAFVFGVESATGVDTYTDRWPTSAQLSAGIVWRKAQNLNSTAVPWAIWGDGRTFYLWVNWFGTTFAALYGFGDFASARSGDLFGCMLFGGTVPNTSGTIPNSLTLTTIAAAMSVTNTGAYAARSHDQTTKSVALGHAHAWGTVGNTPGNSVGGPAYPAAIVSGVLATPIFINEAGMPRGRLRGIQAPLHASGLTAWTGITGVAGMTGATLTPTGTFNNSGTGVVLAESGAEFI